MCLFFFFKQKTAYEVRISDWSSDVCSSDLLEKMAMQMDWMGHHRIVDEDDARALVAFETDRFDAFAEFFAIERPHEAFHVAGEMNLDRALRRARVRVRSERHEVAVGQHLVEIGRAACRERG